jgi:hypothetical protein
MSKQDLYKQAIADAKQLKDITMEAAKQQIAEAFTPKIQEMFRLKVNELEQEYDDDTTSGDMEESIGIMDEATLDEILAELTAEEGKEKMEEDNLEEGLDKHDMEEAKKDDDAEEEGEEEAEEAGIEAGEEAEEGSQEVAELSVEEFKELVRDVVADVLAGNAGEEAGEEGLDDLDAMAGDGDDSISLDEILAELQEEEAIEEAKKMMKGHHKDDDMHKMKEAKRMMKGHSEEEEDMHKMEEELNKANATIQELRSSINELNLFNAKLLYTSKIFESKNLSSSQKAKVLNAFDRANTVKEVKNTYSVLNENFITPEKNQIKESIGFASKPMGNAPGKLIVESDSIRTRMQQLAGILKPNI